MSIATLILGESGTGKSYSLLNLNPSEVLLIQTIKKPLPFRSKEWQHWNTESKTGNIFVMDDSQKIIHAMAKTKKLIIVIDDWNLIMTNEFMRRSEEKGYQKFTEIGKSAWDLLMNASTLSDNKR